MRDWIVLALGCASALFLAYQSSRTRGLTQMAALAVTPVAFGLIGFAYLRITT